MNPNDPTPNFALATHPMLANIVEVTENKSELVFIYGYIGKVTDDTVRLHQGLDLRQFYEIPKAEIVYAEKVAGPEDQGLTKLVLFSTTRITYVSRGRATLPASALAEVVAANNVRGRQDPTDNCRPGCRVNGYCICAPVDYWLRLDPEAAGKRSVMVL
jgi:hypothetical protein